MPQTLTQRLGVRLLTEKGWRVKSQSRHGIKLDRRHTRPVVLPRNHGQPYDQGLNRGIIRQAGLDPKEVRAWISRSKYIRREPGTGRTL